MSDPRSCINKLWRALDARDFDTARALLHPDVVWTDLIEGGRHEGPEAVHAYWNRTVAMVRPESVVLEFEDRNDGRLAARLHHRLRTPEGLIWSDEEVIHIYSFADGLILRMDAR